MTIIGINGNQVFGNWFRGLTVQVSILLYHFVQFGLGCDLWPGGQNFGTGQSSYVQWPVKIFGHSSWPLLRFSASAGLKKNLVFLTFNDGFSEPTSQPVTQDKQPTWAMATSPVTCDSWIEWNDTVEEKYNSGTRWAWILWVGYRVSASYRIAVGREWRIILGQSLELTSKISHVMRVSQHQQIKEILRMGYNHHNWWHLVTLVMMVREYHRSNHNTISVITRHHQTRNSLWSSWLATIWYLILTYHNVDAKFSVHPIAFHVIKTFICISRSIHW